MLARVLAISVISLTLSAQTLPPNILAFGDSLTEGVPHLNGETETYPYKLSQELPGSTYVKLGFVGQPSTFLAQHLDTFLFPLQRAGYTNILTLWAGTNDCAIGPLDCAPVVELTLAAISKVARAAGWKVVVITMIPRQNYFIDDAHAAGFEASRVKINEALRKSPDFDAVADPVIDPSMYWDGTHLLPVGYQVVADAVAAAIQGVQ